MVLPSSVASAQTVDTQAGGTGTITIRNASQSQTYTVSYKLFDATVTADGSGISYKLPAGKTATLNFGGDAWFDVDSKGNVTAAGADLTSAEFKAWAVVNGEKIVSAQGYNNTVFTNVPWLLLLILN